MNFNKITFSMVGDRLRTQWKLRIQHVLVAFRQDLTALATKCHQRQKACTRNRASSCFFHLSLAIEINLKNRRFSAYPHDEFGLS